MLCIINFMKQSLTSQPNYSNLMEPGEPLMPNLWRYYQGGNTKKKKISEQSNLDMSVATTPPKDQSCTCVSL